MAERFDMVVIGSGPAGEKGAAQAAYHGYKVAMVERSSLCGGAAVNTAGIPTKTLRESASYLTGFGRREIYGVAPDLNAVDIVTLMRGRTAHVVDMMDETVRANIDRHGIELIHGRARLTTPRTIEVGLNDGSVRELEAAVVLIATGSRPSHPPQVPWDDDDVLDSEQVLQLDGPFNSLVVIGGSTVGCEYASIFAAAGVDVTLVDRNDRLVRFCDGEISDLLAQSFRDQGMRVVLGGGIRPTIARSAGGLEVKLADGEVLTPDKVFYSAGRTGNTEELGLDHVGVELDAKGRIVVDDTFRTTVEGIYAAGDVIGPPSLASVSMEQGRVAVCYAFGISFKDTVDPVAPLGVYSIPEVAMSGLTEDAAKAQGLDVEVGRGWFEKNPRAVIAGATEGLVKLVFDRADRRLLGVHIMCEGAGELIHLGQAVIQLGAQIDHFIHSTFNVPTRSDAYKYAAYDGLTRIGR
jgi:NAD(P) transhydrogenase